MKRALLWFILGLSVGTVLTTLVFWHRSQPGETPTAPLQGRGPSAIPVEWTQIENYSPMANL